MNRNLHIQEELTEISTTVAQVPFLPTYTIPNNYFKSLAAQLQIQLVTKNTFTIPTNYFENLPLLILSKIKNSADEEENLPNILQQIPKTNVYTVPKNYFTQTNNYTVQAPVIKLEQKKNNNNWLKIAAAACIAFVIAFAVKPLLTNKVVAAETLVAGTNLTFKEIQNINADEALEKLDSTEVKNYLCENGLLACVTKNTEASEDKELQKELDNIELSKEDIKKLEEEAY